jgi:DNA-3-methyladenine glycosylase I
MSVRRAKTPAQPPRVADGRRRCGWPGSDPLYVAYHDDEWGVPERDARALYEKLMLDGFQAGLSWITILRKRENFRRAFDDFDPQIIANYDRRKLARLMDDAGIVRNRAKIEGAVASARAYLEIAGEPGGFAEFVWRHTRGRTLQNRWRTMGDVPAETAESRALSKALKAHGFAFVGPTIVYAFMQAVGMVNDHLVDCFRHRELARPGGAAALGVTLGVPCTPCVPSTRGTPGR